MTRRAREHAAWALVLVPLLMPLWIAAFIAGKGWRR